MNLSNKLDIFEITRDIKHKYNYSSKKYDL